MKKLVLLLAVAFSVSLFSCGGDKAAEATTDTCCTATEEVAVVETEAPATEEATEAPAEGEATEAAAEATEAPAAEAPAAE
ncbi:MAG: hypothetical protein NC405_03550 [Odoribacter sp.]|nr:hypothetical protein [Odoribacter sp.]